MRPPGWALIQPECCLSKKRRGAFGILLPGIYRRSGSNKFIKTLKKRERKREKKRRRIFGHTETSGHSEKLPTYRQGERPLRKPDLLTL